MKFSLQVTMFVLFQTTNVATSALPDVDHNRSRSSSVSENLRGRDLTDSSCFDCSDKNPCFPSLFTSDVYYYPRCGNANMFVQCGNTGECYNQDCPPGLHWDRDALVCGFPQPTNTPSLAPTSKPSTFPSLRPSATPTTKPSSNPSVMPSASPSTMPSSAPTAIPSSKPSSLPSMMPSISPSVKPSTSPSSAPSSSPSASCFDCSDGINPCDPLATTGKYYYSNCDVQKYVQCSNAGQCFEHDCPINLQWDDIMRACVNA
mmetsp:Transcript_22643/g.29942  ORF Transcript_22643/g.29942 Transcript_22643/m.29942 type:complete len:260 (-) Transcript_22643:2374-3153(-)